MKKAILFDHELARKAEDLREACVRAAGKAVHGTLEHACGLGSRRRSQPFARDVCDRHDGQLAQMRFDCTVRHQASVSDHTSVSSDIAVDDLALLRTVPRHVRTR